MRATKYKHYGSEAVTVKNTVSTKTNGQKKSHKKLKSFSFVIFSVLTAAAFVIPTTTLAPAVDAFEDSKAASYSVSNSDDFSIVITDNCEPETTAPATEATTATAKATEKATEASEAEETTTSAEEVTEPVEEEVTDEAAETVTEVNEAYYEESVSYAQTNGSYLIDISEPDLSYSPSPVSLSSYDREKLERLVMGEAGSMGYNGCALVAQAIRDAMNHSGTNSIDTIIESYNYYAPTNMEPNQTVKDAVSYIFDSNGSAVQHRILCFYTGASDWHETQRFIVGIGNVKFFDLW